MLASNDKPLVSILIPAYNSMPKLRRCIDSCLNQTYQHFEIVVVNDGSTDGTKDYLDSLSDSRVHAIHISNSGVSAARNLALDMAAGEYVMFVDADDSLKQICVEDAVRFAKSNKLDIAIGGLTKVYGQREVHFGQIADSKSSTLVFNGNSIRKVLLATVAYSLKNEESLSSFFLSGSVCKLFNKNTIFDVRFDTGIAIGEDTLFNVYAIQKSTRIGLIDHEWYRYEIYEDSTVSKYRPNALMQAELLIKKLIKATSGVDSSFPYVRLRAIREFESACLASVAHGGSKKRRGLTKRVREVINDPFWRSVMFAPPSATVRAQEVRYRALSFFCEKGCPRMIAGYLRAVQYAKIIRGGLFK